MRIANVRAVLLDMDGTLVDSERAIERAWSTWAAEHHVDLPAVLAIARGRTAESTVREMCPDFDERGVRIAAQRQLDLQYGDLSGVVAMPGADLLWATLQELRLPWAVVTSADARLARGRLSTAGIEPAVLITSDDVAHGKPDPAGYLQAAEHLGVEPNRCLVVEDSVAGLSAGRRAGMMTAALRSLDGDVRIDNLTELAGLLSRARDS